MNDMKTKTTVTLAKGIVLLAGAVSSVYAGINYYRAWIGPELKPHPKNYCFQCHSDEKTLRMMKMKAGDDETDPHYKAAVPGARLDVPKKPVLPLR